MEKKLSKEQIDNQIHRIYTHLKGDDYLVIDVANKVGENNMAKLNFRYGAMNSGKTTILIQTAHNYEERNQKVIVIKPKIDTKGSDTIVSRIGASRKVDELIDKNDSIIKKCSKHFENLNCILVDEAQFLNAEQIDELWYITKIYDIAVIAYGLRADFRTNGFEGSSRLLLLSDDLQEMPTICRCGSKARFNARKINGEYVIVGDSVVIDNTDEVEYESVCGNCYINKVLKKKI